MTALLSTSTTRTRGCIALVLLGLHSGAIQANNQDQSAAGKPQGNDGVISGASQPAEWAAPSVGLCDQRSPQAATNVSRAACDSGQRLALPHDGFPCSFTNQPFVHPRIIEDLSTWLSDNGDMVVAINLLDAQDSNRYYGEVLVHRVKKQPLVYVRNEGEDFGYQYVGTTTSGIHVLATTASSDTGTGVFRNLLLVTIERDLGITWNEGRHAVSWNKERLLIRKLGEIPLGDRWSGRLGVRGDQITIGSQTVNVP